MRKVPIEAIANARPLDDTGDYLVAMAEEIIALKERLERLEEARRQARENGWMV